MRLSITERNDDGSTRTDMQAVRCDMGDEDGILIGWKERLSNLFGLAALGRLKEKDLLLHNGVVLEHGEGTMHTRANHCTIIARHSHGNEPDGNGARLRCKEKSC